MELKYFRAGDHGKDFLSYKSIFRKVICIITIFFCFIWKPILSSTWPSSSTSSYAIQREQNGFSEASLVKSFMGAVGSISNSSYSMYWLQLSSPSSISTAIVKTAADGSNTWTASLSIDALRKSLVIDSSESSVYFWVDPSYIQIIKLAADTGAVASVTAL